MIERVFYYWRLLATGFCFVVFGIGGVLLTVFVFPVLRLLFWNRKQQILKTRAVIRIAFQGFIGLMHKSGVLQFEIIGQERLHREGLLILANHPTLIDTVFLMAMVERADCIVKHDLTKNIFTRGVVNAAGYIFNNHGNELIDDCAESLQSGNNLIIFPEGTRTAKHGNLCFKRGAANVAVRAKCNITPVLITCQPSTLSKQDKWWQIPPRPARFRIEVQDDIKIDRFITEAAGLANVSVAARHLTTHLQAYFSEGIRHHA